MSIDDTLAAEYVLGTLPHAERLAFAKRLAGDPTLQGLVRDWETRLADLNADFPEAAPPPDMLDRIEARLFPAPPRAGFGLRLWLGGLGLAAAVLAAALFLPPLFAPQATVVAVLGAETDALRFEAQYDGAQLHVGRIAGAPPPAGRSHELWIIAPEAKPVSLGLIGDQGLSVEYPALPKGWTLAVTLEPAGGGPGGVPTGPVVAAAEITL